MAPYAAEGCKLFVYGISQHISNDELIEEFGKFGSVNDTYNTGKGEGPILRFLFLVSVHVLHDVCLIQVCVCHLRQQR